jgi:hypothetical protein
MSAGDSSSRIITVTAAIPVLSTVSNRVPPIAARKAVAPGPAAPMHSAAMTRAAAPPATAAVVMTAWFASVPYQGWDSISRRSIVERNATHAPAVGPPSTIAAPMNGRWKVRTLPLPGARRLPPPRYRGR